MRARLSGGDVSLVLDWTDTQPPVVAAFACSLSDEADPPGWTPATGGGLPDRQVPPSLFPVAGRGWLGPVALAGATADGGPLLPRWAVSGETGADGARFRLADTDLGLALDLSLQIDPETGVLRADTVATNLGDQPMRLSALASLVLPLPDGLGDILAFEGSWAREARPHRFPAPPGAWEQAARGGRTGFQGASLLLLAPDADEGQGQCLLAHLGWGGSHLLRVETLPGGARVLAMSALLDPHEGLLAPGARHEAPPAFIALSPDGIDGAAQAMTRHARARIIGSRDLVRPVHFNTWEACWFDVDIARLKDLADQAAALGAERFVLDDGWFRGRVDDTRALGDWQVERARFPDGLGPLIDHVRSRGMGFGLWVEPEMASPDSDLLRAHPDWAMALPDGAAPTMRHQLVLDLARPEVAGHIFEALDSLLRAHRIDCLKWDFNRDLFPALGADARTRAWLALQARLRAAHPHLVIENCSSGGARLDLGSLALAERVWPSDATCALSRLRIMRWQSLVAPLSALGAHVGASPNPITGRVAPMDLRAKVALFGWMGIEADPGAMSPADRDTLGAHIALHKRHRALIHGGDMVRLAGHSWMVTARDRSEALALVPSGEARGGGARVTLRGLDPQATYRIDLPLPPVPAPLPAPQTGAALQQEGLTLPDPGPLAAWLVHLARDGG